MAVAGEPKPQHQHRHRRQCCQRSCWRGQDPGSRCPARPGNPPPPLARPPMPQSQPLAPWDLQCPDHRLLHRCPHLRLTPPAMCGSIGPSARQPGAAMWLEDCTHRVIKMQDTRLLAWFVQHLLLICTAIQEGCHLRQTLRCRCIALCPTVQRLHTHETQMRGLGHRWNGADRIL